jgi:4-amino-4-deoxy-L-arabinose transferase-like glycosyltransferase
MKRLPSLPILGLGLGLWTAHFLVRWILVQSPLWSEVFYDEAVTGLMAQHILKGDFQVFFWGQPYMGALEAYLAGFLFFLLGSSAAALRLTVILVSGFSMIMVWGLGWLAGGKKNGVLAAAYWSLPPLFLSIAGILGTGGHVEALAVSAFVILGMTLLAFREPAHPNTLAVLIGLAAGLGWWSSLVSAPLLVAGLILLPAARPRVMRTWIPVNGIGGFMIGSLPFWIWQIQHQWATFYFFKGSGEHPFFEKLITVIWSSLLRSEIGDWWDGHSIIPLESPLLVWGALVLFGLPPLVITLGLIFLWVKRLFGRQRPFQQPIDLIAAVFLVLVVSMAASEQGSQGSLRYSLSLYIPLAVLTGWWLSRLWDWGKAMGLFLLVALLGFNLSTHLLFLKQYERLPFRPVEALLQALEARHIHYAYADSRLSLVITFESKEKVICADFFGQRNYRYWEIVEAAPASELAIITHTDLANPHPEVMAATLRFLGGSSKQVVVGDYVFWYDFEGTKLPSLPLPPSAWKVRSSTHPEKLPLVNDRKISTVWTAPQKKGESLLVELDRPVRLARISLLTGPFVQGEPHGLKVDYSLDGKSWGTLEEAPELFSGGLYWSQGRPKVDFIVGRDQMNFLPVRLKFLRITCLGDNEETPKEWIVGEIFLYEAGDSSHYPDPKAEHYFRQAREALAAYLLDPFGPHHLFPGLPAVSLERRRNRVQWSRVVESLLQAIRISPDWEEPHQLMGEAIVLGDLVNLREFSYLFPRKP